MSAGKRPILRGVSNDLHQFAVFTQRRVTTGDLHVDTCAIMLTDGIQAPEYLRKRNVAHLLGMLGEITQCAIEITLLRDLDCRAADRAHAAEHLRRPIDGVHTCTSSFQRLGWCRHPSP